MWLRTESLTDCTRPKLILLSLEFPPFLKIELDSIRRTSRPNLQWSASQAGARLGFGAS